MYWKISNAMRLAQTIEFYVFPWNYFKQHFVYLPENPSPMQHFIKMVVIVMSNITMAMALPENTEERSLSLYQTIDFTGIVKPDYDLFYKGLAGYYQLKDLGKLSDKKEILTLLDFRKSANEKRMWVIDLKNKKVLHYSLVAHGRNSGDVYATKFSNTPNSNQSSLGFYVTGGTYIGKHGVSLVLHGAEYGINHLAESRAIVMHGAEYVSNSYIKKIGRLGRSFGCPAVPMETYKEIISEIAQGTCLFIYYPDQDYLSRTKLLPPNSI